MTQSVRTALPPTRSESGSGGGSRSHAISIRGVTKTFGKQGSGDQPVQALDHVDLDVQVGEFLVLLGPSGCGKTTLLRAIAGLEQPESGSITIEGQVVFDSERHVNVDAERRPVSMIFQSYALWPHMTAAKNVAFPLECRGVHGDEISRRVTDIMTKVGIEHLQMRYPGDMSGGQQQRLALARALVIGQKIVLFDEPLSNVDAQVRERLRLELIRMQRTLGFTAIYVTHDQSEAMELADRIAVMQHGLIAQLDEPRSMYRRPQNVHVARFLGQSNEIRFTVESVDDSGVVVTGSGPIGPVMASWLPGVDTNPPRPGDQLISFGRPGDFAIANSSVALAANGDVNHWPGRIEAVRFLGTHTQYIVTVGESRLRCWSTVPSEDLVEGTAVSVTIGARQLQAMRDEVPPSQGRPK